MNEQFKLNTSLVRKKMKKLGLADTQLALAELVGFSKTTAGRILNEEYVPKWRNLSDLAAKLGVTERQLLIPRESEDHSAA